ncbi:ribonuclease H2 subunit C [Pantherophis guttatus]|uniref:Ribonuclease H2 subunit C n=1 Tax=Pantherophis guttatus TaxID=94885 RepID=A0A6P9CC03_PANGU|nr:ribonuclease H2 subunit C [Pantherophis guttatus]
MAGAEREVARLALASLPGAPRDPLHLLPCSIQHDGPAAVARYFAPAVRRHPEAPEGEASVSFRGRSLKGKESCLPKGYVGLVLEEANLGLTSKEREVGVKSTFDSLTVWNLERAPSNSDEIVMAFAWPAIARGIHAPVTDEE